jgi:hypothetical protein
MPCCRERARNRPLGPGATLGRDAPVV